MNYPRWAFCDYPGAEKDFSLWLEAAFLESPQLKEKMAQCIDQDTGEILSEEGIARVHALAKFFTLEHTKRMRGIVDRAEAYQLINAEETGWYRFLPPEFDTIEELLASLAEEHESTTEQYDWAFLAKQVIPLLKNAGVPPEDVIGFTTSTSKARFSVPYMRDLLREMPEDAPPEKLKEVAQEIVSVAKLIENPNVKVAPFREEMAKRRGRQIEAPQPIEADLYPTLKGNVIVIHCDETHRRAIEMALRGMVSLTTRDVQSLLNDNLLPTQIKQEIILH